MMSRRLLTPLVWLILVEVQFVFGQCESRWLEGPSHSIPGVNGPVTSVVAWDPDGVGPLPEYLVVGGEFTIAGGVFAKNIAAWDGATWHAMGSGLSSRVRVLATFQGELIAGGNLYAYDNLNASFVVRWNGTHWRSLGDGVDGIVRALKIVNGQLMVGGGFTREGIAGQTLNGIGAWDGAAWHAVGGGLGNSADVWALYDVGSQLFAGGKFIVNGSTTSAVKRLSGSAWTTIGVGSTFSNVLAMCEYQGRLIVGGDFPSMGGVAPGGIVQWNGSSWQAMGLGVAGTALAFSVFKGKLIVGGDIAIPSQSEIQSLTSWDGTTWTPIDASPRGTVRAIGSYRGSLVAGGWFSVAGSSVVDFVSLFDGQTWKRAGSGLGTCPVSFTVHDNQLAAACVYPDTLVFNDPAASVSLLNVPGWHEIALGWGYDVPYIQSLFSYHGELLAGGALTASSGMIDGRLAGWNGSAWRSLAPVGVGNVRSMTEFQGNLIAGGSASYSVGFISFDCIAQLSGDTWSPLGSGVQGNSVSGYAQIAAMVVHDGSLYVGGSFATAGGLAANDIARWDGAAWHSLGTGTDGSVTALTVYNSELVVAGGFSNVGGVPARCIAAWDGVNWHSLGAGLNYLVNALAVHDGKLVVGGNFTMAGDMPIPYLATWDGNSWGALSTGVGPNRPVDCFLVAGNELIIGGSFGSIDDKVFGYWARWGPGGPKITAHPMSRQIVYGQTAQLSIDAESPHAVSYQWRRRGQPLSDNGRVQGSKSAILTLVNPLDAGPYDVVVTDTCNSTVSNPAVLQTSASTQALRPVE